MPFSWAASSASAIWRAMAQRRRPDWQAATRPARDPLGERLALDEFQHQPAHAVGFFDAVDRADVRVIQRGEHARLALEARAPLRVGDVNAGGRTLIATSRPSVVSCARYTSPMPPTPSSERIA